MIGEAQLRQIVGGQPNQENLQSFMTGLKYGATKAGLDKPHRLAMFIAQWAHESQAFRYDREIWGPTPAQARYDTRTDLGNTPAKDGDGFIYRGRTAGMLTGKDNYRQFTAWAKAMFHGAPDFVANPEMLNGDPWEGLVPIWYWDSRHINVLADKGDFVAVTKAINGGVNGLQDRWRYYDRAALVMLGAPSLREFQRTHGLTLDGFSGPQTRRAMHEALKAMTWPDSPTPAPMPTLPSAPRPASGGGIWVAIVALFAAIFGRK